ncbi:MAG: DUF4142 domain-containing protein [Steroidobacteraceae bacterium]
MSLLRCFAILTFGLIAAVGLARAETPTDAQIAEIVVKANQVDVNAGRLAMSKTADPKVKEFASEMIAAHTDIGNRAVALVKKLGITPEPSVTSHSLEGGGAANVALLSKLSGREFDQAYIGHEVAYHKQVLAAVDEILVPSAQNPELKALLRSVRPIFVAHLEHAQAVRESL